MDRGSVGEERGSKETDGCPLTAAVIVIPTIPATATMPATAIFAIATIIDSVIAAIFAITAAAISIITTTAVSVVSVDTPQAPSPCVDRSRPKHSDVYWSNMQNANAMTLRTLKVDDIPRSIFTVATPGDRSLSHL
jgi:hypothetical protein